MSCCRVCAIVVTYHPDDTVVLNLAAIRKQIDMLIVVDNGSREQDLEGLVQPSDECILNEENFGIARALNQGIERANLLGAEWIFLFDQDSCATEGMVDAMLEEFERSVWGERLGILVPRYRDRRLLSDIPPDRTRIGLHAAMTSGSLLRSRTFAEHGMFVDDLFIDAVDYEFSLRLRRAGLVLEQCDSAVLLHSPGDPEVHRFGGRKIFLTANYSPVRRYYQERNKVWVARRYFRDFPFFCTRLFFFGSKDLIKIILGEHNKRIKLRFFLRGTLDGLRERMGRLDLSQPD